jgi:protein dispatched 1
MVGLAVDYIVHMAASVAHCGIPGCQGVQFALRTVGLSVVSGAVTTIGAAVFLLPCEMAVFQQFGVPPRSDY